jgi:hypothetical protein
MAENLPQYTWSATVLTPKGTKKVVYSTVTGKVVGEIRNGKFVQTADKIPQPTKKKPKTVSVPETARAGGVENTIAAFERDAAYYKSVAEDVDSSPAERARARQDYNNTQSEIAKLKGQAEEFQESQKAKESATQATNARQQFDALKTEYQGLQQQFDLLIDKNNDPKAAKIRTRMNEIINDSLDVYSSFSGKTTSVQEVTKLLKGETPTATSTGGAPTGTTSTRPQITSKETPTSTSTQTSGAGKTGATTGSMPKFPSGGKPGTGAVGAGFDPGRFRMGEEASMGAARPTDIGGAITGKRTLEQILGDVGNYFDIPDYIFKMDTELSDLLVRAVNEKWTTKRWGDELELTNWYRKNNANVRQRLTTFGNYEDLRSQGQNVDKSDYGLWLSKKRGQLKADAQALAGVAITDAQADEIAKKIYLGFLDDDENAIRAFLVPFISKTTSIVGGKTITGYSGQALKDFQTLQSIAKANGLALKDILPGISATTTGGDLEEAVLEKIALGELDVNRISQDARMMAAIGQPEFVRGLLNQGYDLDQVYSPYKNVMARVLDLNPEEIDLNDPTLRSAITDKGETNLYDFQRGLRKDSRWQYTEGAREEVANSVLGVLRDFGFQG